MVYRFMWNGASVEIDLILKGIKTWISDVVGVKAYVEIDLILKGIKTAA